MDVSNITEYLKKKLPTHEKKKERIKELNESIKNHESSIESSNEIINEKKFLIKCIERGM